MTLRRLTAKRITYVGYMLDQPGKAHRWATMAIIRPMVCHLVESSLVGCGPYLYAAHAGGH